MNPNELLIFTIREDEKRRKDRLRAEQEEAAKRVKEKQAEKKVDEQTIRPEELREVTPAYQRPEVGREFEQPVETEKSVYVVPQPSKSEVEKAWRFAFTGSIITDQVGKKSRPTNRREKESREAAKNLFCSWHPWRSAYAVCDYCHRPFCFEDITEFNHDYYCLEDVDKISVNYEETMYVKYSNISLIGAGLLMMTFALYIFFASDNIVYVVNYINQIGLNQFLAKINYNYALVVLETAATLLSIIAGILIFVQSRKGFWLGLFLCAANVTLFSYEYLNSGTLYTALIAGLAFVALIALSYSRISYAAEEETPYYSTVGSQQLSWPNVGRF